MNKREFLEALDRRLMKILGQEGFAGDLPIYIRHSAPMVNVIEVQEHSTGEKLCVNLCVHFDFLPAVPGKKILPVSELDCTRCEIKRRLAPNFDDTDFWWKFKEGMEAISSIEDSYKSTGRKFFRQYEDFPSFLRSMTVASLEDDLPDKLPGLTRLRAALMLARIHESLGTTSRSVEFAKYGLDVANPMATGPKRELKKILRRLGQD